MAERLDKIVLVIDAPNVSGSTAVFEFYKDRQIVQDGVRNFAIGGRGQLANETIDFLEDQFDTTVPYVDTEHRRAGWYVDAGEGDWIIEITATLSETQVDGSYLQMGTSANSADQTKTSATGGHPQHQAEVLHWFATQAKLDSANAAELHVGNWHDGTYADSAEAGIYGSPLPVTITEMPRYTVTSDESSSVEVVFTCKVLSSIDIPIDAVLRSIRGT